MTDRDLTLKIGGDPAGGLSAISRVLTGSKLMTKEQMILTAGFVGLGIAAVKFGKDAFDTASKVQADWATLKPIIDNTGASFTAVQPSVQRTMESLGLLGGYTDEQMLPAFQRLVMMTHDVGASQTIMSTAVDLSHSGFGDLQASVLAVGRAYDGYGARVGKAIGLDLTHVKGMTAVNEITQRVKGATEAWGDTVEGQEARAGVAFDQLKVTVGNDILPIVSDLLPGVSYWLRYVAEDVKELAILWSGLSTWDTLAHYNDYIGKATASGQAFDAQTNQITVDTAKMRGAFNGAGIQAGQTAGATDGLTTSTDALADSTAKTTHGIKGEITALDSLSAKERTAADDGVSYIEAQIASRKALKDMTTQLKKSKDSQDLVTAARKAAKGGEQSALDFLKKHKNLSDIDKKAILDAAKAYQDQKDKANDAKTAVQQLQDQSSQGITMPGMTSLEKDWGFVAQHSSTVLSNLQNIKTIVAPKGSTSPGSTVGGGALGPEMGSFLDIVKQFIPKAAGGNRLSTAEKFLGVPYLWGGTTPAGFDCSGLMEYVGGMLGVKGMPRTAADQGAWLKKLHRTVPFNQLEPGDQLFFGSPIHHTGMYAGNGKMINAPFTGADVRFDNAFRSDLVEAGRWPGFLFGGMKMSDGPAWMHAGEYAINPRMPSAPRLIAAVSKDAGLGTGGFGAGVQWSGDVNVYEAETPEATAAAVRGEIAAFFTEAGMN